MPPPSSSLAAAPPNTTEPAKPKSDSHCAQDQANAPKPVQSNAAPTAKQPQQAQDPHNSHDDDSNVSEGTRRSNDTAADNHHNSNFGRDTEHITCDNGLVPNSSDCHHVYDPGDDGFNRKVEDISTRDSNNINNEFVHDPSGVNLSGDNNARCCDDGDAANDHNSSNHNRTYNRSGFGTSGNCKLVYDPGGNSFDSSVDSKSTGTNGTNGSISSDHRSLVFDPGGDSVNSNIDGAPSSPDRDCSAQAAYPPLHTTHDVDPSLQTRAGRLCYLRHRPTILSQ
jgi:hypothetical protein